MVCQLCGLLVTQSLDVGVPLPPNWLTPGVFILEMQIVGATNHPGKRAISALSVATVI